MGVFDSGFGGLDILKNIIKELPQYNYVYLGDTARMPYGTRSQELIYNFTEQAIDFLFKNNCQLIILACNTASSQALRRIQQEYLPKNYPQKRVLGVIIPATETAIQKTINHRIGVIATQSSVDSKAFEKELKKLNSKVRVFQKSCPLLVPIIEAGEQNSKATQLILENYLKPLIKKQIDTLILGCTHYGYLKNKIRKIVGKQINIISQGKIVAKKLKDYLFRHPEIERKLGQDSKVSFLTTDLTDNFKILGAKYFGQNIKLKKVSLE
ncbi:glutamate racemase [Patescibacteria group bacterium]|nr:glutamate racemase [Patescibacteria group bacterium]MBU1563711.1 glutamate racemase [Patescibacteria group bacterium]